MLVRQDPLRAWANVQKVLVCRQSRGYPEAGFGKLEEEGRRSGSEVCRRILHSTPAFDLRGLKREIGIRATVSGPHYLAGIRPCNFVEADF